MPSPHGVLPEHLLFAPLDQVSVVCVVVCVVVVVSVVCVVVFTYHLTLLCTQITPLNVCCCDFAADREPQCPNTSYSVPSASILNDIHSFLTVSIQEPSDDAFAGISLPTGNAQSAQEAIASTNLDSVVILGHSLGGYVTVTMFSGMHMPVLQDPYHALHHSVALHILSSHELKSVDTIMIITMARCQELLVSRNIRSVV